MYVYVYMCVMTGMFDSHKLGKNIRFVNGLWSLQVMQMLVMIIGPAIFAANSTTGVVKCAAFAPDIFWWGLAEVIPGITGADVWLFAFFVLYVAWIAMAYRARRGVIPEAICSFYAMSGFVFVAPIYTVILRSLLVDGIDLVGGTAVVCVVALPAFITLSQSISSGLYYLLYIPYFIILIMFYLVFLPAYSFARIWDT